MRKRRKSLGATNALHCDFGSSKNEAVLELLAPYLNKLSEKTDDNSPVFLIYISFFNDNELESYCSFVEERIKKHCSKKEQDTFYSLTTPIDIFKTYHQLKKQRENLFGETLVCLHNLLNQKEVSTYAQSILKKFKNITESFNLTNVDESILRYLFIIHKNDNYKRVLESIYENKEYALLEHFSTLTGFSIKEISKAFSKKGQLCKCGILDYSENIPFENNSFCNISATINNYLSSHGEDSFGTELYQKENLKNTLSIKDYPFSDLTKKILKKLLKKNGGTNILFYGEPGLGKTSLAKSLAKQLKTDLIVKKENEHFRINDLKMLINCCNSENDILLIDEADELLNTYHSFFGSVSKINKSDMNELLESHNKKIIWITNQYDAINSSTCRRFDYSLEFKPLKKEQRKNIWERCLKDFKQKAPLNIKDVENHFLNYSMSPANIKSVLETASLFTNSKGRTKLSLESAIEVQKQQKNLVHMPSIPEKSSTTAKYSLDAVNTDTSLSSILTGCEHYLNNRKSDSYPVKNVSILFYGAPGCGKTEFAKHLAQKLDKELISKKASDLIDCYVGNTEKNIASAFSEAETDDKILFIDEADSLLQDRGGASKSWEVSQVNELLVQMENFKGIVLFSTNYEKILDKASLRRFHFKIKFSPIDSSKIVDMFYKYFPEVLNPLKENFDETYLIHELKGVTFGDFKVVSIQLALGQIEESLVNLVLALKHEINSRGRSSVVGF